MPDFAAALDEMRNSIESGPIQLKWKKPLPSLLHPVSRRREKKHRAKTAVTLQAYYAGRREQIDRACREAGMEWFGWGNWPTPLLLRVAP